MPLEVNPSFERYYRTQGLVTDDDDWKRLIETLSKPLWITFRVIDNTVHTRWVRDFVAETLEKYEDMKVDGQPIFRRIPWYTAGEAYELKADRATLRKDPALRELSQFLIKQSENGLIVRQEAVSMIPACFLTETLTDDKATLLDLCSAPGSKTSQLLEGLARKAENPCAPRGAVIANDLNTTRAHMLVHHVRYQQSPALLVTLHNAALFPRIWNDKNERVEIDGVLCDVPCSGDGTIRKALDVMKKWNPSMGLSLHRLQCKILKKGLALVKVGGRCVYSTCSLNPMENESVVAAILRAGEGSLRLEKVSLPGCKHREGLTKWGVPFKDTKKKQKTESGESQEKWYYKFDEVPEHLQRTKLFPSMFEPEEPEIQQELKDKCLRILPHDNDTGGFFVAVLTKVTEVPWETGKPPQQSAATEADATTEGDDAEVELERVKESPEVERRKRKGLPVDADTQQTDLICVGEREEMWNLVHEHILKGHGLEDMPSLPSRLWARLEKGQTKMPRRIQLASPRVATILKASTVRQPLRVLYAGVQLIDSRPMDDDTIVKAKLSSAPYLQLFREKNGKDATPQDCQYVKTCDMDLMRLLIDPPPRPVTETKEDDRDADKENKGADGKSVAEAPAEETPAGGTPADETPAEENRAKKTGDKKEAEDMPRVHLDTIEEGHLLKTLSSNQHYIFATRIRDNILTAPVYVGRKNVEVLVPYPVRESIKSLLNSEQ